jgi:hypothetical protein
MFTRPVNYPFVCYSGELNNIVKLQRQVAVFTYKRRSGLIWWRQVVQTPNCKDVMRLNAHQGFICLKLKHIKPLLRLKWPKIDLFHVVLEVDFKFIALDKLKAI